MRTTRGRFLAYLIAITLLMLAGLGWLELPLGVRNCLDAIGPNGRVPCDQPDDTPVAWLGRHAIVLVPAIIGTVIIVATGAVVPDDRAETGSD